MVVVIAGINFDDGRMFDLLRPCKSFYRTKRIPFVTIKCLVGELDESECEAVDMALKSLDGDGFIDLYCWMKLFGADQSYEELRNYLDTPAHFRRAQDQYNPGFCHS